MTLPERRRHERLILLPPVNARLRTQPVRVLDISATGSRVEHDSTLVRGEHDVLHLEWEGEEFTIDCSVIRCDAFGVKKFASGLIFAADPPPPFKRMLGVLIRNRDQNIVGVLQLLNKNNGSFGRRDLEFLASISDHMAIAMENATMHLEIVEKQRMEHELQLGREIQSRLLPMPPDDF